MWPHDTRSKYGAPEKRVDQMDAYIKYFQDLHSPALQPHIFYIDARWGSLNLMQRISAAQCYAVLSCSASMRPQGLIAWMKSDLEKGDWWSIGWPPAKANLITIRTKKKVYLNLLTNWAALRAVPMTKRKRKYPQMAYTVNAPFVQKDYNKFKCSVDKWNKALLEYYRPGVFINADVMYTQFFIHAFTLQSWILYKGNTGSDCSQLEFRKMLLKDLAARYVPQQPEQLLARSAVHWPVSQTPNIGKCQYCPSRSRCTHKCIACNKWGCLPCLEAAHVPK